MLSHFDARKSCTSIASDQRPRYNWKTEYHSSEYGWQSHRHTSQERDVTFGTDPLQVSLSTGPKLESLDQ